jgi:hypothetical protein
VTVTVLETKPGVASRTFHTPATSAVKLSAAPLEKDSGRPLTSATSVAGYGVPHGKSMNETTVPTLTSSAPGVHGCVAVEAIRIAETGAPVAVGSGCGAANVEALGAVCANAKVQMANENRIEKIIDFTAFYFASTVQFVPSQ